MLFPWNKKEPPLVQPLGPPERQQVDAAVLVCDTFLAFDSDTAVYRLASEILQQVSPESKLAQQAIIKAIVGHRHNSNTLYTNMFELLQLILTRAGLLPQQYQIEFFEIEVKKPPMWIWYVAAFRSNAHAN